MPYQILLISLGKHQELATKDGFASKAVKISCVMAISWCILELLGRNPDWLLFNMLPLSKNSQILVVLKLLISTSILDGIFLMFAVFL